MLADRFGHPVASLSRAAVDAIDGFSAEVLSHGKGAAVILDAPQHDPHSTLAHACCAALYLFLQTAEGVQRAAPWLARARQCARQRGTERERLLVTALAAWARGDTEAALAVHLAMARRWPRDLLNLKLAQIHQLNLGARKGMVALTGFALAANRDVGHAWGLHAFALEQAGDLAAARAAGEHAVSMNADDPWAQHAVAHVFEALGAWQAGIRWLEALSPSWERCSSFMYTHNWWHLALFHLAAGAPQRALALFDTRVWGVRKSYVQDQVNAVSLLARLERGGADVGGRWCDVAAHVRPRIFDRQNAFLDLHFAYALARAGDDVAVGQLLRGLSERARTTTSAVWRDLALPAARGVIAYARGQWREAAAWLGPLRGRLHRLGGSTAQQRWFEGMCHDVLGGSLPGAAPVRRAALGLPA